MSNQRQTLRHLSFGNIVWFFCTVAFFISTSSALSIESKSDLLLSSCGLTDQQFEKKAKEYLGVPYRRGGTSRRGMDCSGFARTLYDNIFSLELPHSSVEQYQFSELQKIPKKGMQPGDLIFFADKKKKRINHVGVYLSKGKFIHASSSLGITVSKLNDGYWKKRFVGSKRHTALNSSSEAKQMELESSLEIPVNQNGTITGYVQHDFQSRSATFLEDELGTFKNSLYDTPELDNKYLNFYQIGYNHSIADELSVHFSAFREKFDPTTAWPGLQPYSRDESYWQDGLLSDTALRRGFQLAGDIHPGNWLSITPFITLFDNASGIRENWDVPTRTFGVSSILAPSYGRWSLAMLLQYSDQQDPVNTINFDNMLGSLDMSVKLGFHLTENLQFSVMGRHDIRTAYDNAENSPSTQSSAGDVFLTFDLTY